MNEEKIELTKRQASELKFFCANVIGIRGDYHAILDKVDSFDDRIARLEKTCKLIENFLGEKIKAFEKVNWGEK